MLNMLKKVVACVFFIIGSIPASSLAAAPAMPVTTVVWTERPIVLTLIVDQEQLIEFPEPAAVGVPAHIADDRVLSKLMIGRVAYWTAREEFSAERVKVRLQNGRYLLMDVAARLGTISDPPPGKLRILLPAGEPDGGETTAGGSPPARARTGTAGLFDLIRYAAQNVYAPPRLVDPVEGVQPATLGALKGKRMDYLYDNGAHTGLRIKAYEAWSAAGLYVTTFVVANHHSHSMVLDSRRVKHRAQAARTGVAPHFIASAFFHPQVSARGESGSRTMLFVVTDTPMYQLVR